MRNCSQQPGGAFLLTSPGCIFTPENLSPASRLIGEAAGEFLRRDVLPEIDRIEAGDHALMHRLMQKAGALGLLGADVPRVYGGLGLDLPTAALIAERINPQQSFALTHEAHTVIATLPLLYFGSHAQKAKYLPLLSSGEWIGSFALSEANSGSDALGLRTTAQLSPDGRTWRLNGMKTWITNSAFARLFTVFARVDNKITAFLVERPSPGLTFGPEEKKLGMRGTSTRRVVMDNVPVPVENALPIGTGHYAALCALNLGRFKLEAGAVGGLKATLDDCIRHVTRRRAFGKTLASFGMVQQSLARMAARIFALESMIYRVAGNLESGFSGIVADASDASERYHRAAEEYAIECNVVKVLGSESYSELTDDAIQLHGGYGYTENFPVARAWRDQRLLRIGEGANEIVRVAIIQQLLRRDRSGRLPILSAPLPDAPAKRLALLLVRQAVARLSPDELINAQELAAPLADLVCAAYALESVALRAAQNPGRFDAHATVASDLFAINISRAARYALACLDDSPRGEIGDLITHFETFNVNPMHNARTLAEQVLGFGY